MLSYDRSSQNRWINWYEHKHTLKAWAKHAHKQPNRLLVLLHLVGTHFTDFTCQWNQADKQELDLSHVTQCYSRIPLSLCFNPFNSTFGVSVDVRVLLRHLETQPLLSTEAQRHTFTNMHLHLHRHTHNPQQCRGMLFNMKHRMHAVSLTRCENTR